MKVSTKPISSPGRTEKFQPPLMLRFLRGNVGSKSSRSSRSRASPMFVRKKNTVIDTNQEPSSPKVSCIGQVRVRRSGSKSNKTGSRSNQRPHRRRRSHCSWVRKALFSHKKLRPSRLLRGLRRVWRKWVLFFRFGYCKKVDVREDSLESSPNRRSQYQNAVVESEQERAEIEEDEDGEGREELVSISPPKNAFLLTRCRSAPYRSSSLASRFWGSPLKTGEDVEEEDEAKQGEEEERETLGPASYSSSRIDQEDLGSLGIPHGRNSEGSRRVEGLMRAGGPLILTRCKSEPATTGEKLMISQHKVGFC